MFLWPVFIILKAGLPTLLPTLRWFGSVGEGNIGISSCLNESDIAFFYLAIMDLQRAGKVILSFIVAKISETSLALPCSIKWTLSLKYKLGLSMLFPWSSQSFVQ